MSYPFFLIDVFSPNRLRGNPLAVVVADQISSEDMMAITRWLNFSETSFLLQPTSPAAEYRVRIFTPEREMPFAGHPTLGTCHAWLSLGNQPRVFGKIVQECEAGLVRLRHNAGRLAFAAPPLLRSGPVDEESLQEILGVLRLSRSEIIDIQWADNGPGWVVARLGSAEAVLALEPASSHSRRLDIGVVGPYPEGSRAGFEVRAFFTDHTGLLREDPVTGSLNASIAQWLLRDGITTAPYIASQGARLGRTGEIFLDQDETGQVWVGGDTHTQFVGTTA